jgi:translation initiation factor 3 subunit B
MVNLVSEMTAYRCMFVEFKNVDDANLALATIHNHPFDAKHTFKANRLTDIERYSSMDETYTEPELGEYTPKVSLAYLFTG